MGVWRFLFYARGVNMGIKTENKMAYEPVNKLIIQMSAPPLISMFFQYSYNLVDSMFVAGINEQALAAVSLAFPITTLMNALSVWIGVGGNVLIAGYLGQKNQQKANSAAALGVVISVVVGVLINFLSLFIINPYYSAFTQNKEIFEYGIAYMSVCVFMQIPNMVHIVIQKILQATGNITADVNADWCVLKEVNPNEVVFEVKENTGYSGRNALLTISNGIEKKAFNINQSGAVFIFGKDEWMLRTDNKAATLPIKLQSSFDYVIDIPAEAQSWLSFEQNAKGINFKVKENTSGKMRGAIVNVTAKDRSTSYQVIQYDVDELIGTWQGMFSDGQMNYGLKDVTIEKLGNGTYQLSNMLTGLPYKLKAKAVDNCLALEAGQNLGVFENNSYLSFEILSSDLYYVKDPSVTISLGPVMLTDGTFVFAFSGIKESDPFGFVFRVYEDAKLQKVIDNLSIFINCILFKEDIIQ